MKAGERFEVPDPSITLFGSIARRIGEGGGLGWTERDCERILDFDTENCYIRYPTSQDEDNILNSANRNSCKKSAQAAYRLCKRLVGADFGGLIA